MEIVSCVVFEEILVQSGRKHLFFFGLFFLHLGMKFNFTDVIAAQSTNTTVGLNVKGRFILSQTAKCFPRFWMDILENISLLT